MALENLFDTATKNFQELLGNGKRYKVPNFQRDYSWELQQWQDLFDDLYEIYEQRENHVKHYIGSIVLEKPDANKEEYYIIDGQQRITTLLLLILAIIEHLEKIDTPESKKRADIYKSYINFELGSKIGEYFSRLELNRTTNDDFKMYFNKYRFDTLRSNKKFNKTTRIMIKAFKYFAEQLESKFADNSQNIAYFVETIASNVAFIVITTNNTLNSYTIFETLNSRGVELTSADLLKNYILQLCNDDRLDLEDALLRWNSISDKIDYKNLPDFIRDYLNSFNKYVRHNQLFRNVKAFCKNKSQALELLTALDNNIDFYLALSDPYDEFWSLPPYSAKKTEITRSIKLLNLFGVTQFKPVLLACQAKNIDIAEMLSLIVKISFRYHKVAKANPNEIEKLYNDIAVRISNNDLTKIQQIKELLKNAYVSDEVFKSSFINLELGQRNKELIKYIFVEIEAHQSDKQVSLDYSSYTVEHILPQSIANTEWENNIDENQHQLYVANIGNLTLLDAKSNNSLQNKWADKQKLFADNSLIINKNIAKATSWTIEKITHRAEELAKIAAHIWKINF